MNRTSLPQILLLALAGCGQTVDHHGASRFAIDEPASHSIADHATPYNDLNLAAGSMVLYEAQVRTANACNPGFGSDAQRAACASKIAPPFTYRAQGMQCGIIGDLQQIRLGTLDDMMEDTADFRSGITLRYIKQQVGANTVWLMPLFPNNDTWSLPDACDNLGSPYAVRDYFHPGGTLSRRCVQAGRDEYAPTPCWAGQELDQLIAQAHAGGLKVMLDLAFNHFGHNYLMYDATDFLPVRERIASGQDLDQLWDYAATEEDSLLHPDVLDTPQKLTAAAAANPLHRSNLAALQQRCPLLQGDPLVRAYNMWREALDWERARFPCDGALEAADPGFYLGRDGFNPSQALSDDYTSGWPDVKFLFHHEDNVAHVQEFVRTREYLFRAMNYWVSRGVDGFRLDHTTDSASGLAPNEWKYIFSKVDYYAWKRGQAQPVYLAEEFADQMGMNQVTDAMTEGYVGDMCARGGTPKDAGHVEGVLSNMDRFMGHAFVMTALETHDEKRLLDGTGFDIWTGAGFFGIGATTRSMPMLLMGQELGEVLGLGFKRNDFLRSRFVGSADYNPAADALIGYYRTLVTGRLRPENRALLSPGYAYLRTQSGDTVDPRLFAQVKWSADGNVVFVFHNLWEQAVAQTYFISPQLGATLLIGDQTSYRLVDIISGRQMGACRSGADLKWGIYVQMDAGTRAQWLRLETCG